MIYHILLFAWNRYIFTFDFISFLINWNPRRHENYWETKSQTWLWNSLFFPFLFLFLYHFSFFIFHDCWSGYSWLLVPSSDSPIRSRWLIVTMPITNWLCCDIGRANEKKKTWRTFHSMSSTRKKWKLIRERKPHTSHFDSIPLFRIIFFFLYFLPLFLDHSSIFLRCIF